MNEIKNWLEKELPGIADQLDHDIIRDNTGDKHYKLSQTGRGQIYKILDKLLAVLFPGSFCKRVYPPQEQPFFITDALRFTAIDLQKVATQALIKESGLSKDEAESEATRLTQALIEELPVLRKILMQDVAAAYKGDPAATSIDEIILSYPCVDAISTHRIAHFLYRMGLPIIPRIMSERAHSRTGIDIHPGAEIQGGFFIDHGTGVVIGETCRIGNNVKIYQGVTLGALSPFDKQGNPLRGAKRHPDIEDDVIIYANATILGGETVIGAGAVIGGNCWITKSIPPGAVAYHRNEIVIKDQSQ